MYLPSWCLGTKVTPRAVCTSTSSWGQCVCHWGNVRLCLALAVLG